MNKNNNQMNKPIAAVSLALVFVLLLVAGVFVFGSPDFSRAEITLPEKQTESEVSTKDPYLSESTLLQITPENASMALLSLKRPEYYHQSYSVSIGEADKATRYDVELWVNGAVRRAEIIDELNTKIILANQSSVYIWYNSDKRPVFLTLDGVTFEDILGLPAFDYLQTIQHIDVTDAEYLVMEDAQTEVPCIFLSLQEIDGAVSRYWVDLTSGLLYQADCVENNTQVYHVTQTAFDRLVNGDELFSEKFLLPDGTAAFTEGT